MSLVPSRRSCARIGGLVLVLGLLAGAGGCAMVPAGAGEAPADTPSREGTAAAAQARSLATMTTFQYITIDPERTGLVNVADDGRYTYLAFGEAAPAALELFDAEGEPLDEVVRQGRIAAVGGIHAGGILVRVRTDAAQPPGHTFIAPNPRAQASDRPDLASDPELVEARARLENLTLQGPAFRRAIERAESRQRDGRRVPAGAAGPTGTAGPAGTAGTAGMASPASWPSGSTGLPLTVPSRGDAGSRRTPRGNLVRVFFASGGRAIVRPDDGLALLEEEAGRADEIHVAGYADGVGSEAANTSVARARAEAIQSLLVKRGIAPERIFVSWQGTGNYLADNGTEEGRAMNRRVEVLFVRSPRAGVDRERRGAR